MLPTLFPPEAEIALNLPVLFFSVAVSVAIGVICGLWPALRAARIDARRAVDAGSHKLAGRKGTLPATWFCWRGKPQSPCCSWHAPAQPCRSCSRLMHADLGYDPHHLLSVSLALHEGDHPQWSDRVAYFEQIRTTMDTDPDILSSAAILEGGLPPSAGQTTPVSVPENNRRGGRGAVRTHQCRILAHPQDPLVAWPQLEHSRD